MASKLGIIKKLAKLADHFDEMGMISEADRIDTISKLLAPGETWACPVDFESDPMDNFFDFLKFTKNIHNNDLSYRRGRGLKDSLKPKPSALGDKIVEWLGNKQGDIVEKLKEDIDDINYIDDGEFLDTVFFSGSLKLSPSPDIIEEVKALSHKLPDDAKMLKDEKMHVTLINQHILKPYRPEIKQLFKNNKFPQFSSQISLEDDIIEKTNDDLGRKSWRLNVKNQQELQDYVDSVMEMLGGDPHPEDRTFHVTVANLTGNSSDSVV